MSRVRAVRLPRRMLTFALLTMAAGACDESPTDGGDVNATMSVFLTDAPGDVDSVWVQVDDVVLAGDGGNISLLDAPTGLINVTALVEETEALVEGVEIEPGSYAQVRFVLGGGVLETEGGEVYTFGGAEHPHGVAATGSLQCPSCAQSGIKVKIVDRLAVEEGANALLLDFDISQSFGHVAGQSGQWVMHPVINGATVEAAVVAGDGAPGRISGTVALGDGVTIPTCGGAERTLASFVPTATATVATDDEGNPLVFTGATVAADAGFTFTLDVLAFDGYTMGYDAETTYDTEKLVWTAAAVPTTVSVTEEANEVTGVAFTVSSVTCEPLS